MKTFKYYQDAGHGWLAVKRQLLIELGISDKITRYSYQKGATVYLEEDCDMSLFLQKYNSMFHHATIVKDILHNRYSPIRNYQSYKYVQ